MKKAYLKSDNGENRYISADGNGVAKTKSAAEIQAIELAKFQLAGSLQTIVAGVVESNIGNEQLSTKEAETVNSVVMSAKNIIATQLGYIDAFYKIYRDVKGTNNVEVQVKIFYDTQQAIDKAKNVIKKELREKMEINQQKVDKLLGL
jgi:hypothetical protein